MRSSSVMPSASVTNLAIMQPYLFPYFPYFQLIASVEKLVFYEDVGYIKQGWVNRNHILVNGAAFRFTVPIRNRRSMHLINEVEISYERDWVSQLLSSITHAYKKAPQFEVGYPLIEKVLAERPQKLATLAMNSIMEVSSYLGLKSQFVSSTIYNNTHLHGQDRVLDICEQENCHTYTNAPGGVDLYDAARFTARGMELRFVVPQAGPYAQLGNPFVPNLSVIDAIMFNDRTKLSDMLLRYSLSPGKLRLVG